MIYYSMLLSIGLTLSPIISSFNVVIIQQSPARIHRTIFIQNKQKGLFLSSSSSETIDFSSIDKVNVCMGELCKCQEGDNAESIMNDLQSRNLPFAVEDAPCLGACGVGSMVSIEYMDGDYALVTGLEETLEAIGIHYDIKTENNNINSEEEGTDLNNVEIEMKMKNVKDIVDEKVESMVVADEEIVSIANEEKIESSSMKLDEPKESIEIEDDKVEDQHDAIKRMRAEASKDEEQSNPWVNMAFYIGKKISDSIAK